MNYRIFPPDEMIEATVSLPLSKSISNRLLVINALTLGDNPLPALADCDDTRVLADALTRRSGHVDIGPAGTAMRFLTAFYAATPGCDVLLDGNERMRQRPIGTLVEALRHLGADITYTGEEGFPPLHIKGSRLRGGDVEIDAEVSSQFVSAILMVAPTMETRFSFVLRGEPVSLPYIRMTLGLMQAHGIDCDFTGDTVTVNPGSYTAADVAVEADWSAASYWYEIAAISAGFVTLKGLLHKSLQGDSRAAAIFADLGVETDFDSDPEGVELSASPDQLPRLVLDMASCPDLVPAVVVTAVMLRIPFALSGLASLRIKECDRVEAIIAEMRRIGAMLTCENNTLTWELQSHPIAEMPRFETHGDHRMAMALAPVSLFIPGIVICDAEVVNKSYPGYWDHLKAAGFRLLDGDAPMPEDEETDAVDRPDLSSPDGLSSTNPLPQ